MTSYYYSVMEKEDAPEGADFGFRLTGRELEPYFHPGDTVFCKRDKSLRDGDVGLFILDEKMVCRQYCEDALGNIHLFSVNRALSRLDFHISGNDRVFCFGRVIMERVPLPAE